MTTEFTSGSTRLAAVSNSSFSASASPVCVDCAGTGEKDDSAEGSPAATLAASSEFDGAELSVAGSFGEDDDGTRSTPTASARGSSSCLSGAASAAAAASASSCSSSSLCARPPLSAVGSHAGAGRSGRASNDDAIAESIAPPGRGTPAASKERVRARVGWS